MDLQRRPTRLLALLLLGAVLAGMVAACGSGDEDAAPADDAAATTTTAPAEVAFANPWPDHTSEVYADDAHWLCRPDLTDDVCDEDLTATEVAPVRPPPFGTVVVVSRTPLPLKSSKTTPVMVPAA